MRGIVVSVLIAVSGGGGVHAIADQMEEHDPVRMDQRLKDCVAEYIAKQDGRSRDAIRQACEKAVAEGSYHDPNIGLDGMIKSPSQQ